MTSSQQNAHNVVGQDKVIAHIARVRKRGLDGRAFWISGDSGQGMTTIARLLVTAVANSMNIEEIDSADAGLLLIS